MRSQIRISLVLEYLKYIILSYFLLKNITRNILKIIVFIRNKMAIKKLTKWCIVQTHEVFESIELTVLVDQRRDTNLLGQKAPSSFFFFYPNGILSLPPGLTRQPGAVYLSPFCIGQFPLFRGISKPILGLA